MRTGVLTRMEPILPGTRGPAVEDIQKRLLQLGFDLGVTGVDGVFLGKTREAVRAFQSSEQLAEDGVVGDATWAALVDATFTLGDRMLYLRLPHLHGRDVGVLQRALNTLGFSCGTVDEIFGRFTERAVREFQRNCGQPDDGIAGPETVRALLGLKHVWDGKEAFVPSPAAAGPARSVEPLLRTEVLLVAASPIALDVAQRVDNLARASDERVRVSVSGDPQAAAGANRVEFELVTGASEVGEGVPVVLAGDDGTLALAGRLVTARAALTPPGARIVVDLGEQLAEERDRQRAAVRLLDALCASLA